MIELNKTKAIEALTKGKTLRHRWFSDEEWIKLDADNYLFEDGETCSPEEFWKWRTDVSWLTGWFVTNVSING